jgi:hypothetical protein
LLTKQKQSSGTLKYLLFKLTADTVQVFPSGGGGGNGGGGEQAYAAT